MIKKLLTLLSCVLILVFIISCSVRNPVITIETEFGKITAELYPDRAPVTVSNFLRYIDSSLFDSSCFYRVVRPDNQPHDSVKIEVIQGGRMDEKGGFPPVIHENTGLTGIKHKDGVISMARDEPGSATSEFFICVGDQPDLDFGGKRNRDGQGFAAFGRVVSGMDVVRKIHSLNAPAQYLDRRIIIYSIKRK